MHIPDGFLSPRFFLPSYGVAVLFWGYALRRVRSMLNEETLPWIGVLSALSFVLMTFSIPLPGGSSVHATGVPLLAILFGSWISFLCVSIVLVLQTLVVGEGGITALAANALAMGLAGSIAARTLYLALRGWSPKVAIFTAAFVSTLLQAVLTATALGVQPLIASDASGSPLFFPFGLGTVLPAVLIPHIWVAIAEGVFTVFACGLIARRHPIPFVSSRFGSRESLDESEAEREDGP